MKASLMLIVFTCLSGQLFSEEVPLEENAVKGAEDSILEFNEEINGFKRVKNLYDLMYQPVQGTFFGSTESLNKVSKQSMYYQAIDYANSKTSISAINQKLGYSYNSEIIIGVGLSYLIDSTTTFDYGSASTLNGKSFKSKEKGFTEPSIFLSKRIKSQEADNFNIDVAVSFSPKIGNSKSATTNKVGNALRGANEIDFDFDIGKKDAVTSWVAGLSYTRTGEAKNEKVEISADQTISDVFNVFGANFTYQWIINRDFEINLLGEVLFLGETNTKNQYSSIKNEIEGATMTNFGPTFILNYSANVIFELSLIATGIGDRVLKQTNTITGNVAQLEYNQLTSGSFNLATKYEF